MAVGYLERSRIVAPPGWSRWLVSPAALSIHLAIGQAYAWSVFKKPRETSLGISGVKSALPFTLGIVMLGNELIHPVNPRFHELASEQAPGKAATAA